MKDFFVELMLWLLGAATLGGTVWGTWVLSSVAAAARRRRRNVGMVPEALGMARSEGDTQLSHQISVGPVVFEYGARAPHKGHNHKGLPVFVPEGPPEVRLYQSRPIRGAVEAQAVAKTLAVIARGLE